MSKDTESVELVVVQKLENALSAKINVTDDAQDGPKVAKLQQAYHVTARSQVTQEFPKNLREMASTSQ